jgi:putative tryptophan/tyrosine transport system substrate-binding protein
MRRRDFIGLLGGAVASRPLPAFTQDSSKRPLIVTSVGGSRAGTNRYFSGFSQGMREFGYVESRDYDLELRYADGRYDNIPAQMDELVRLKPDIIVSGTMAGVLAAKKLTNIVPIVAQSLIDPIGFGVAASQARPGGNVTGVMTTVEDLPHKLLELALETVPGANSVGLLVNPTNPIYPGYRHSLEVAARARGIELTASEASTLDDLHAALQRLARERVKVVLILADAMFINERKRIALFAVAERLPTISGFRENVEDGGLISYGTDLRENWRRAASFVDKILKGAKPGDLPIEFPTKLELVINLISAKALGLEIPPTLLARADEVIE